MISDERFERKFQRLLSEGNNILASSGWNGSEYYRHPSDVDYQRWRTEAQNLIEKVCGRESAHYEALKSFSQAESTRLNSYYMKDCVGILEGAYKDFQDGMLDNLKHLIRADILDDFLTQAEMLLENGYSVAAVSIAGAVLEDTLRKLCDKNSVIYSEKTNINNLNTALAKKEVYDKLVFKEITAKADLRNTADHGHFDKVRLDDAKDMVRWIRRFVTEWMN